MKLEVLVSTMNQSNHDLLKKMNIQSDVIIGNQCDRNEIEEFKYNGYNVKYLSFAEKGVGLNRNNSLMRTNSDISVIGDDDLVYIDNYEEIIRLQFLKNPQADIIIFNLIENPVQRYIIKKKHRINYFNYMRYGAARITFRTRSVTKNGIFFNTHFGGGTEYGSGEDVLFLTDCLKKGLKIIAVPISIAYLTEERESTWFEGYNQKFFEDKGALFSAVSNKFSTLLILQFALRKIKSYSNSITLRDSIKMMFNGRRKFKMKSKFGVD